MLYAVYRYSTRRYHGSVESTHPRPSPHERAKRSPDHSALLQPPQHAAPALLRRPERTRLRERHRHRPDHPGRRFCRRSAAGVEGHQAAELSRPLARLDGDGVRAQHLHLHNHRHRQVANDPVVLGQRAALPRAPPRLLAAGGHRARPGLPARAVHAVPAERQREVALPRRRHPAHHPRPLRNRRRPVRRRHVLAVVARRRRSALAHGRGVHPDGVRAAAVRDVALRRRQVALVPHYAHPRLRRARHLAQLGALPARPVGLVGAQPRGERHAVRHPQRRVLLRQASARDAALAGRPVGACHSPLAPQASTRARGFCAR
eukprot:648654-Prymnesium_polylepis.1